MNRQNVWGPVFLAPALLLLLIFYVVPFFYALQMSFYDIGFAKDTWVGLENYRALLQESGFWGAIRVTGKFVVAYFVCSMVIAYALGLGLSKFSERFCGAVLVLYRVPTVVAGMTTVVVWRWFYRYPDGGFNQLLGFLHLPRVPWLGTPTTAAWAICIIMSGLVIGGTTLLYVIAIGQIDKEMLEAARVDGASELQLVRYIITPLTHRVRLYLLLTSVIAALNIWEHPFFFTGGGPLESTTTVMFKVYHKSLIEGDLGMGSALTTIVAVCILLMAYAIVRYLKDFLG